MKYLTIVLLIFSFSLASAQDFWEEIELPSNRPVYNVEFTEEGEVYTSGKGIFRTNDFQNWEDINEFYFYTDNVEFGGELNSIGDYYFNGVYAVKDSILIGTTRRGYVFISYNNGRSWTNIDKISNAKYVTNYGDIPYVFTDDGIFTLRVDDPEFQNITNDLKQYNVGYTDRVDNTVYINASNNEKDMVFFFDLESEEIIDSVNITEIGIDAFKIRGYYETENYSYIYYITSGSSHIHINPNPIRNKSDMKFDITPLNLYKEFDFEFEIGNIRVLKNNELFLRNNYGGFILGSGKLENIKVHKSPIVSKNIVRNIKYYNNEYYLCTETGLYRSTDNSFSNYEFLSENMGTGIYPYINYKDGKYELASRGVLYTYDGNDIEIKDTLEKRFDSDPLYKVKQWNDAIWYDSEDKINISKDFGDNWKSVEVDAEIINNKYVINNDMMIIKSGSGFIQQNEFNVLNYNTLETTKKSFPNEAGNEELFFEADNELYVLAGEGIYSSNDQGDSWNVVNKFDLDSSVTESDFYRMPYNFINIGKVIFAIDNQGVVYTNDFGENWETIINLSSSNISYKKLGNKLYISGWLNNNDYKSILKLSLDANNEVQITEIDDGINNMAEGYFTYGSDKRLYASFWNGNYRSIKKITSVDNLNINEFNIETYPNPTNGKLNINVPSEIRSIEVYDLQLQIVKKINDVNLKNIDLRDLSHGTYFLILNSIDDKTYFEKVVKK